MALQVDPAAPIGQFISDRNRARQYDYLQASFVVSMYGAGLDIDHDFICSLNFYATQYISPQPGRYRRHYNVEVETHKGRDWPYVYEDMAEFIETLHSDWGKLDPLQAAAYAVWGVNHIHPFCDGNGRTARALSYFVLCKKLGRWLPGETTVMELIRAEERDHYCEILQRMHDARGKAMTTDLAEMTTFLNDLVLRQIRTASEAKAAGA
jgi:hypothetical protein